MGEEEAGPVMARRENEEGLRGEEEKEGIFWRTEAAMSGRGREGEEAVERSKRLHPNWEIRFQLSSVASSGPGAVLTRPLVHRPLIRDPCLPFFLRLRQRQVNSCCLASRP